MNEKIEKLISDLKQFSNQLAEVRDYYWLKIDRSCEKEQQKGKDFDNKFERIKEKYLQTEETLSNFLKVSFYDPKETIRKKAIEICYEKYPNFEEKNEVEKNTLIQFTIDLLEQNTFPPPRPPINPDTNSGNKNKGTRKGLQSQLDDEIRNAAKEIWERDNTITGATLRHILNQTRPAEEQFGTEYTHPFSSMVCSWNIRKQKMLKKIR